MKTTPIYEVMTTEVYEVAADTSLETAARLLTTRNVSGAPVVSPAGKVLGVVTLADLADPDRERGDNSGYSTYFVHTRDTHVEFGDGEPVGEGMVADVMCPHILTIPANATLAEAALLLAESETHRLLVVHRDQLVGIVTAHDVLRGIVHTRPRHH